MNKSVDSYLLEGCGCCPHGGTPDCKVHHWTSELRLLRSIVLSCGSTEKSKWGVPCYTYQNKNVLVVSALKNHCSISFFKGALLADNKRILEKPGQNSQAVRLIKFTSVDEIKAIESEIKTYLYEAVEVKKAGLKVKFKKNSEPVPEELEDKFEEEIKIPPILYKIH